MKSTQTVGKIRQREMTTCQSFTWRQQVADWLESIGRDVSQNYLRITKLVRPFSSRAISGAQEYLLDI